MAEGAPIRPDEPEPFWARRYPPGMPRMLRPDPQSIPAMVAEAVSRFGPLPMLTAGGETLTYAEVDALARRFAAGLAARGVGAETQVALCMPNCLSYAVALLGGLMAGARVVSLSALDAERELLFKVNDSGAVMLVTGSSAPSVARARVLAASTALERFVLTDVAARPGAGAALSELPDDPRFEPFEALLANDGVVSAAEPSDPARAVALLQYTGGTTGEPKAAMLTHANVTATGACYNAWTAHMGLDVREGAERMLVVLPLSHIYGLSTLFFRAISVGWHMVLLPRFDAPSALDALRRHRVTLFAGVPTMYTAFLAAPEAVGFDWSALKFCNSGGAPLPAELADRFEAATGIPILEGWGLTETAPAGTSSPSHPECGRRRGSCGMPLPGVMIEIEDMGNPERLLGPGETGEICVRGPSVMLGYWKRPDATAEALAHGRFHTGDIGYLDEDGFLFIVDRKKDMILSGGFNVYPRVIEEAIWEHQDVREVTVIGVPDAYRGQAAKAFVSLRPGAAPFTLDALRAFLADKVGKHEMPAALEFRDELPKTVVGKLSKKELVEEERRAFERERASRPAA